MKRITVMLAALQVSFTSFALDIDTAKSQGLLGEQTNGYLGVVVKNNAEATKLADEINRLRKQKYAEIAAKQKTALSNIETIAGTKLIERARADKEFYQTANGSWSR